MSATAMPQGGTVRHALRYPALHPEATTVPAGDPLDGEPDFGAEAIIATRLGERTHGQAVRYGYDRHVFMSISKWHSLRWSYQRRGNRLID
jgi:hypothetical protein